MARSYQRCTSTYEPSAMKAETGFAVSGSTNFSPWSVAMSAFNSKESAGQISHRGCSTRYSLARFPSARCRPPVGGARRSAILASTGSHEQFASPNASHWGFTARSTRRQRVRVEHPRWKIWPADSFELKADIATLYGEKFVEPLTAKPVSAFIADGSYVEVQRRTTEP